ncbi:DUF3450 domain-containing protein [Pseudomonas saliphila]|uniref:DUF3450 domain-containing protein n=1 Tax=Pseudomonas saliphila TaxID=2586906 RepID=UPI00123A60D8|nr:DUF3450 domain-containing protein [Pseudomonas saliphila]
MKVVWLLILACMPGALLAQDAGDQALSESERLMGEARDSQQRIDALDDATRDALQRYRQAIQQREQLGDYNKQLAEMVQTQRGELESLQTQLASIEETQREVLPMLQRMLYSLETFVSLDVPFQLEERNERLGQLRDLMAQPDVSVAEKYRRVLEAYQIESDYGRTLEAWRGPLEVDGSQRVVDFLRLGRVMLFYQTLDGRRQGYWDAAGSDWAELSDDYHRTLQQGLNIAHQQQTPVMLRLPLPPVEPQGDAP